jgi:hypothetical protein
VANTDNSTLVANLIMAAALIFILWNLVHAKRKGEINVGFAKYIHNGSPSMKRWFIGGVVINVIWVIALIAAFVAQLAKLILK